MKKLIFLAGLAMAAIASAQVLNVEAPVQLNAPAGDVKVAGISADGSTLLLTTSSNVGLRRYDMATGEMTTLSEAAGAGYRAQISADGKTVTFREKSVGKDKMMRTELKQSVIGQRKAKVLVRPTRDMRLISVSQTLEAVRPTATIENRQLVVTIGGVSTVISPCGQDKSYIWPSISPDGQRVLFYVSGKGAYVSDLAGKNVVYLGHDLRAPQWYNNEVVIGMNDRDNGEVIVSSEIIAVNMQGTRQVLTNGINAMYPYAANGAIVCSGFQGETYLIKVTKD
ncbi:MAG: PD40 domain-containing protein [Paludibacteraceae bacterium]|nr:PD40 domain-containing protein [Paludibacteraceae bacterium]